MPNASSHRRRFAVRAAPLLLALAAGCGPESVFDEPQQLQVAAQLRFVVQPPDGLTGQPLEPTVTVEVVDGLGERVRGLEMVVQLQLPTRTSAENLRGAATFTKDGRGSFPFLSLQHAGAYELEAYSPGLASARSRTFTISNALSVQPPRDRAGTGEPGGAEPGGAAR